MTEARYRIVGGLGARERVLCTGLTREEAAERVVELMRDRPMAAMWFAFEAEASAAHWDEFTREAGKVHGK